MKKKIINILIIIISFVLMYGAISINEMTIRESQERILDEQYNKKEEVIEEEVMLEEGGEAAQVEEEEKTNSFNGKELAIIITSTVIFVMSFFIIIYSTMNIFNAIKMPLTTLASVIYVLLVITVSVPIIVVTINYADKNYLNGERYEKEAMKRELASYVVKDTKKESNKKYESVKDDETVLKVTNESTYEASKLELNKKDGKVSKENKDSGINDVVLVNNAASVTLKASSINTKVESSNAIFAEGQSTRLELDDLTITTKDNNSKGIVANNQSEVSIKNSVMATSGMNSPLFTSSSIINAENITGTTNSHIATIFNTSTISITNSIIETELKEDKGIFNIESNSTDSSYETASLTLENSTIKLLDKSKFYKTAPMFVVNNTNAQINITKNKLRYGSNILLSLTALENSSLKTTTFTISDSVVKGNIIADKNSKARININTSTYTGSINPTNASTSVDVTVDKYSTWNLTGNSYVDTITFQNQKNIRKYINSNGYNIYCNAENNDWLEGKTITLIGGGKLIPIKKAS